MKKNILYIKIAVFTLLFSATAVALALQVGHRQAAVKTLKLHTSKPKKLKYDAALLDTLVRVAAQLDLNAHPLTYVCELMISDGADTATGPIRQRLLLCKNGDDCYYKLDDTETLNAGGFYVYIDHEQKRILLSRQRGIQAPVMGVLNDIKTRMQAENYQLVSSVKGNTRTLTLLNEKHISCKAYGITYNTLTRKITSVNVRLSNPGQPENTLMDKTIGMNFISWPAQASPIKFLSPGDVFTNTAGTIQLTDKYKDYELVNNL
ncbi:hypothetical protein [Mucilaginibacter gilvus]|uniref:DUF4292 domain-containing protein n=1 Tax=Mucilaginibacter gilvus TaxID=2305909 RepID=A0A3S3YR56_9SPHI|nr:hypothetical protein [Mucilaginibacter gilvus]RWY48520.1 hypothetical protein EPL05_19390 [Mucilaginibacter gilvus]